jgi:integral membrane sensor domain MASE1
VGGAAGAIVNLLLLGQPFEQGWLAWAIPGGMGMAIVLPGVLLTARAAQYREFERRRLETLAILAGQCVLVGAVFVQSDLPLRFVIFPSLTLVAVRLGPPGAAAAGLLTAMIALPLTLLGHGPTLSPALGAAGRVRLTELVIAAALFTTLVTAVAVAEQTRLRRLMLGRDRAARAALVRARQAERVAAAAAQGPAAARRERVAV